MTSNDSKVTIHMVASLDRFIARADGATDWLHTQDAHEDGAELTADDIAAFLKTIDCYVMGSRAYETASMRMWRCICWRRRRTRAGWWRCGTRSGSPEGA